MRYLLIEDHMQKIFVLKEMKTTIVVGVDVSSRLRFTLFTQSKKTVLKIPLQ